MADIELIAEGIEFPEGPIALADGSVLVVEIKAQSISRIYPDGQIERLVNTGGGPNGIAVGPDGRIYVANNGGFAWADGNPDLPFLMRGHAEGDSYIGGQIQTVDLSTSKVEVLYTECNGNAFLAPNDLVFDNAGGFYFTDTGIIHERYREHGGLYYAKSDGSLVKEIAYPLQGANGVGLSPDGKRVYVGESGTGIAWAWDIESPGVIAAGGSGQLGGPSGGTLIIGLGGHQLFDSLAIDSEGNICGATLITGAITVISPEGKILDIIKVPDHDPLVTNICFGGEGMRTAYITSGGKGRLYKMQWHCPGLRLEFNAIRGIDF